MPVKQCCEVSDEKDNFLIFLLINSSRLCTFVSTFWYKDLRDISTHLQKHLLQLNLC